MGPSYGMAECTLLATTRRQNPIASIDVNTLSLSQDQLKQSSSRSVSTTSLNSSGSSCSEQILRIVEQGKIVADGQVGEIWLKGEHIAQGYWQKPELNAATFAAYAVGDDGEEGHGEGDNANYHQRIKLCHGSW